MQRIRMSPLRNQRAFSLQVFLLQLAFSSVVAFLNHHPFRQHVIIPPSTIPASPRRHLSPFVFTTVLKPPTTEKSASDSPHHQQESESMLHSGRNPLNYTNSSGFNDPNEHIEDILGTDIAMDDSEYNDLWDVTTSSVVKVGNTSSPTSRFGGISFSMDSTNFPTFSFADSWKNYSTYSPQYTFAKGFYNRYGHNYTELSRANDKSKRSSKSENLTLPPVLEGKIQADDSLTLSDLQEILKYNGYVRKEDLGEETYGPRAYRDKTRKKDMSSADDDDSMLADAKRRTAKGVAFPQPSILSYRALRRGTTLASATYGIIIASTIFPNLWLMGVVFGSFYGYGVSNYSEDEDASEPAGVVPTFCLASGRKLAKTTLDLYDKWQGLWFLYKTGQLSYEYYKQYEALDQRFAIQDKMDAWNARFQEGKVKFDNWEKENEVSRTILAGLRTVWLVDEQAKLRAKQTSRYRLVQYFYNVKFYIGRGWKRLVATIQNSNSKFWGEFVSGIRQDMKVSGMDALQTRIGAVVASLLAIYATGALYAISAPLLAALAVLLGVIWPSWVAELSERMQDLFDETRARGRGDEDYVSSRTSSMNMARVLGRYDKKKYHYYKRPDGSKQYYRTGQSFFRFGTKANDERQALPWNRKLAKQKPPPTSPWGIFGSFNKGGG